MEEEGGRRRRLVLVPYPLQGHITPMLQLGTILHSRGFSITIALSKFDFPDTSNHPDFVFQPLSNDSLSKFNDPDDIVALISNLNLSYRVSLQKLLIEMIEKQQLEQQDHQELPCIIYDPLVYSAEAVAHHLKLPSIVLPPSSVAFLLAFYACPKIEKEGYTPFQESKSLESVPELYPLRFKDLPVFDVKSVDDFLQFATTTSNLRTSCMILNSIDCLEQQSLVQLRQKLQIGTFLAEVVNI
ncbi:hypothetical protein QYF36_003004 [Acer negundo]|nr:hypothetical protein QYF36_003004 [Acer negundo]